MCILIIHHSIVQVSFVYVVEHGAATAPLIESASRRLSAGFRPAKLAAGCDTALF